MRPHRAAQGMRRQEIAQSGPLLLAMLSASRTRHIELSLCKGRAQSAGTPPSWSLACICASMVSALAN